MNYYERHIGDYLKDTAHLSLLEHGIYTRLLDVYYTRESGIDEGMAARLVGARSEDELVALRTVLSEFFVLTDGVYIQARCAREIERYQDKQRKAKASADARWSHTDRNATAMPTHSEGNAPSLQSPVSIPKEKEKRTRKTRATSLPDDFKLSARVETWAMEKGYRPADVASQTEAFVSYAKRKGATYVDWDEALMTAIREDWAKVRQGPATETNYARSMREKYEQVTPLIAAKTGPRPNPLDVIEGMTREPIRIAR